MERKTQNQGWKLMIFAASALVFVFPQPELCSGGVSVDSPLYEDLECCDACGEVLCTSDCPYWNTSVQENECYSCEQDPCCETSECVPYKPWVKGSDAGLYCLPGSRCTSSCSTLPSGAYINRTQGKLVHKIRYPIEWSPQEWKTIMMHMRVLLPMTACDYRKVLSFLQEIPFKPEKKIETPKEINTASIGVKQENHIAQNSDFQPKQSTGSEKKIIQEAKSKPEGIPNVDNQLGVGGSLSEEMSLEELIGPISTEGVEFLDMAPSIGLGREQKFNHVFTGYMTLDYTAPFSSFFGDFNGNNSFSYLFVPIFLSSYGEHLLLASKLAVFNFGQSVEFVLPYSYVAYFYNDYLTIQAGKILIPFGVYWNLYIQGWTGKSANSPLARTVFEDFAIAPNADIGIEVKGAIPLSNLGSCFQRANFTYDFWLGNGPSEVNVATPPVNRYPIGSIYYNTNNGNSPNNNNEITWGGRLGLLPNDCNSFGISYMRGRWDSNKRAFGMNRHLYFEGAAFDWNMHLKYVELRGEYLWTQYENGIEEFKWVRQAGYWAEVIFPLSHFESFLPNLYCWNPCLWDSLEFIVRSDAVWSQESGRSILGFDYSGFDKRRVSLTLDYYFTQSFIAKVGYDFNYGDTGLNTTLNFLTGATRKTGYAKNVFTFRIAYGW